MDDAIVLNYEISGEDFTRAGEASSDVKKKLKQMGVGPEAIRKVAIAMYEGEINMVIHANGGRITVEITPDMIKMILDDVSFFVQEGDRIEISGKSGCGKSTFVKLLLRLYDVTEGEIYINGKSKHTVTLVTNTGKHFID